MPVDRDARDALADALAAFMKGQIGAREFERRIDALESEDDTIEGLAVALWTLCDDITNHTICVSQEGWNSLRRILAFLKSDLELYNRRLDSTFGPFEDESEWRKYEGLLEQYDLPAYDPDIHNKRVSIHPLVSIAAIAGTIALLWCVFQWMFR